MRKMLVSGMALILGLASLAPAAAQAQSTTAQDSGLKPPLPGQTRHTPKAEQASSAARVTTTTNHVAKTVHRKTRAASGDGAK